ncbi:hypothetical protein [Aeromicrobium sp. 9AM]|uniref:hypothetical protein n=1 Tax=Aeromicrobium sp. 9AM TaxID=2653126 RepID=UPI0012F418F5|nr:hypothetical protein [Aeromicrobium sp. 9AM]VXC04332.1 conserved membrane hypothetical protein [Aeromicrobium sp. 9AM]
MSTDAEWVELRVHGVSGTPPESLLAHPHVAQTDGGGASRFFSAVDSDGAILPGKDGQALEAYHWGHYTSGTSWQALWLLLVPFGLINAAQFMVPAPASRPQRSVNAQAAASALLRLLALLLTLLLVFAVGLTLMDLVAWRWAPSSRQLASWNPSAVLMLATLFTAAVVVGLWLLGRITATSAPNITGGMTPEEARARAEKRGTPLADPYFYQGTSDSPILSRLHLAAALLLVAAMARWVREPESDGVTVWVSLVLLLAVVVVVVLLGDPESLAVADLDDKGLRMRATWHAAVARLSWIAVAAGVVMIGRSMAQMPGFTPPKNPDQRVPIEGYELISVILLLAGVVGVCALVLVNWRIVATTPSTTPAADDPAWYFRPYARGWAASVVAALAVFVGVGLSASLPTTVSSVLHLSRSKVGVTPMLDRVSYAWGLTFFVVLGIGLWLLGDFVARRAKLAARARAMFVGAAPVDAGDYAVPPWHPDAGSAVLAMWIARLKNHIPAIALTFVGTGVAMSLAIVYEIHPAWDDPRDWRPHPAWGWFDQLSAGRERVSISPAVSSFSNVTMVGGAWMLLGLAALIVFLARRGFKTDTSRRGVNVVWDVISFWPHAVHPFVPKPYSQHTVMHLRKRIKQHLATHPDSGRDVIVSAHSQGSLIAFASLHLLSDDQRARVGLLTYGSQLRQIFPRAFPAYVNYDSVSRLHLDLHGGWINLYRETDPLAGPVLSWNHLGEGTDLATSGRFVAGTAVEAVDEYVGGSGVRRSGDDWRLLDPAPVTTDDQYGPSTRLFGHSDYFLDPAYRVALRKLRGL